MKKSIALLAAGAILMASALTACGSQPAKEEAAAEQSEPEASVEEAAAETEQEQAPEEAAETETPEEMPEEVDNADMSYMSPDGWVVRYNAKDMEAAEIDEHTAQFVYLGESAGTNMVTITYVADKSPEEVIADAVSDWNEEEVVTTEGTYMDTEMPFIMKELHSEEGSGQSSSFTAISYNDGTVLLETVTHSSGNDEIDIPVSDAIANIFDSLTFEELK